MTHGGKRPGAGRPQTDGERHNVNLRPLTWAWLNRYGKPGREIDELAELKMPKIEITQIETDPELDGYHRNTGGATKTAVYIDPKNETAYIRQDEDTVAVDEPIWNGRIMRQFLEIRPDQKATEQYMHSDEAMNLVTRVVIGYDEGHNDHDFVGWLNADAQAAWAELIETLEALPESNMSLLDPGDWFIDHDLEDFGLTVNSTEEQIAAAAADAESTAKAEGALFTVDLADWLKKIQTEECEELED